MIDAKQKPKLCGRCRKSKCKGWKCRDCGRKVCEHYCRSKTPDGMATCGRCAMTNLVTRLKRHESGCMGLTPQTRNLPGCQCEPCLDRAAIESAS